MKAIRIAALGVALVISSATVASAQQQQGAPGGGRPGRGNMLMVGIDSTLTADQKAKLAEITTKYAPETQAIRDLMATDREGAMKKRVDLQAKQNPEIRAILTKEQQAIFDKNIEEAAKRAAAPRPAPAI
jgi:Spy/CpxP family protein refolding chaperone